MPQYPPEDAGQAMAQALVARLEALKREVAGPEASLSEQLAAGTAAVEALKAALGGVVAELLPPKD